MLKLADIKFPITFQSRGVGHFMFSDKNTCTKFNEYGKPDVSTMEIEHFIDAHNKHYNSLKDYGYARLHMLTLQAIQGPGVTSALTGTRRNSDGPYENLRLQKAVVLKRGQYQVPDHVLHGW